MAARKERDYFQVGDRDAFEIYARLKKKGFEVSMVTCSELKVTWLASKYTRADIEKIIFE
jgi:hypothetical protein